MKKILKFLMWLFGILVVLLILLILVGPRFYAWIVAPDHEFGSKPLPEAPDYALRSNWSGWPDDQSPAERLPDGVAATPQSERLADAFFLHPTTYGGKGSWVQPMDDEAARRGTDFGTTSRQASAFNGCCRVYAPRYRQSNIMGYQETDVADQIFTVGYEDTRRAFFHFIEEIGPDKPFVLGSHSQGTFHLIRLIMEEIDGTPLADRMIAAYAIGHSLSRNVVDVGMDAIEICQTTTQTGCFITWDAHEGDKTPSRWSEDEEEVLWNGIDYSGFEPSQRICVNPITWRTDNTPSDAADHLGALPNWDKHAGINDALGALVPGTVSAYCDTAGTNWLFVNSDRDERLRVTGLWAWFSRNLHGNDYSLFWANIRQNAIDRTEAWYAEQSPTGKSDAAN